MRILIITNFYRNGQTAHTLDLCAELKRQGHEVYLIISRLDCPSYATWLVKKGIPYSKLDNPLRLLPKLKNWRPDLIHNHSAQSLDASTTLGRLLQIPSLNTIHYLDYQPLKAAGEQSALVLISTEMRKFFQEKELACPLFVVENGVLIPTNTPPKKFKKRALFLARVTKNKERNFAQMADLLLAWGWEVKSAGNWRYPGVKYLGWVTEIEPLLATTDLVIGTGRTIREGMAANCLAWVLGDYSDGLVTPGNVRALRSTNFSGRTTKRAFDPRSAARFLENPNPKRLHRFAAFGEAYARKHFPLNLMVEKICQIYHYVLENQAPKGELKQENQILCQIYGKREGSVVKLVITVVEDNDVAFLMEELVEKGFQATKLASTGGFLLQGNTTLLIGVKDDLVDKVLEIIRSTCAPRKKIIPQITPELPTAIGVPIEIEAGGAIVFVVDVAQFWKL